MRTKTNYLTKILLAVSTRIMWMSLSISQTPRLSNKNNQESISKTLPGMISTGRTTKNLSFRTMRISLKRNYLLQRTKRLQAASLAIRMSRKSRLKKPRTATNAELATPSLNHIRMLIIGQIHLRRLWTEHSLFLIKMVKSNGRLFFGWENSSNVLVAQVISSTMKV